MSALFDRISSGLKEKIPGRIELLGIFASTVVLVYSWTLFNSFYRFPSWIFYLTVSEILSIYAYAFLVNFLESIALLVCVLVLEFSIFYGFKNRKEFQTRSIIIIFVTLVSMVSQLMLYGSYEEIPLFLANQMYWWLGTVAAALFLSIIISKISIGRRIVEGFAERASFFLYIYMPLTVIALLVVLIRNLW